METKKKYLLLGDEPDRSPQDPLGFHQIAEKLTDLIHESSSRTPFTVGVQAPWGMGKSSLMLRMHDRLEESGIKTIWFNAWRYEGLEVLEGLIKSVLFEIDDKTLGLALSNMQTRLYGRFGLSLIARLVKLDNLVDQIWDRLNVDARLRNEFGEKISAAMAQWARGGTPEQPRLIVVFIDDLDRCAPEAVLQVFEAIKLYLGMPGMVFVIGYDGAVVGDAISSQKEYSDEQGNDYIEKIVQVDYHIPRPTDGQILGLARALTKASVTESLFSSGTGSDPNSALRLVTEGNGRNPRRIKRFINRFILDYQLLEASSDMNEVLLMKGLILRMYFAEFAELFGFSRRKNALEDFMDYATAAESLRAGEINETVLQPIFDSYGISSPEGEVSAEASLQRLDEYVPSLYKTLLADESFRALVESLKDADDRRVLEEWIVRSAVDRDGDETKPADSGSSAPGGELTGLNVLWIDDVPKRTRGLRLDLEEAGANIVLAEGVSPAMQLIGQQHFEAAVGGGPRGIDFLEQVASDLPDTKRAVYLPRPSSSNVDRAKDLGLPLVSGRAELADLLSEIALESSHEQREEGEQPEAAESGGSGDVLDAASAASSEGKPRSRRAKKAIRKRPTKKRVKR